MESIFNPSIRLQPWIHKLINSGSRCRMANLVHTPENTVKTDSETAIWMPTMDDANLWSFPDLFHNPTKNLYRAQKLYDTFQNDYRALLQYREKHLPPKPLEFPMPPLVVSNLASCNEIHCIVLAIGMGLNAILRTRYPNKMELQKDHAVFCADVLTLGEDLKVELPMGAVYLPLTLTAAWLSWDDPAYRERLKQLFDEYKGGYAMSEHIRRASHWKNVPESLVREFSWIPNHASVESEVVKGTKEETDMVDKLDSVLPMQPGNGCCFL